MVQPSLQERIRRIPIYFREWTVWLAARKDLPNEWFRGAYSRIKFARLALALLALLAYSAYSLGTDFTTASYINLWYGLASSAYIIVAIVFLLGLRTWYGPSVLFLIVSAVINFAINFSGGPLGIGQATIDFAFVVTGIWLVLVIGGLAMMVYDRGSKLNDMLAQS